MKKRTNIIGVLMGVAMAFVLSMTMMLAGCGKADTKKKQRNR